MVIESEKIEVEMSKTYKLLMWLADVGVQHVSLCDMEGILKQSNMSVEETLGNYPIHVRNIKKNGHLNLKL